MKYIFYLSILLLVTSCSFDNENINDRLDEFLKSNHSKSQFFKINPSDTSKIVGVKGSIITFYPNSFVKRNGDNLVENDSVQICLVEVYEKSEMIYNNVHTISNGRPLVSSGMIHIQALLKSDTLKLKDGCKFKIEFENKNRVSNSNLFYGEIDSGNLNWIEYIPDTITIRTEEIFRLDYGVDSVRINLVKIVEGDTIEIDNSGFNYDGLENIDTVALSKIEEAYLPYFALDSKKLNWINCDYFLNISDTTYLNVAGDINPDAQIYLILDSTNSVLPLVYYKSKYFKGLPSGYKAKLLSVSSQGGQLKYDLKNIETGKDLEVKLNPVEVDKEKLKEIIDSL